MILLYIEEKILCRRLFQEQFSGTKKMYLYGKSHF